jgi:hypothetical protein
MKMLTGTKVNLQALREQARGNAQQRGNCTTLTILCLTSLLPYYSRLLRDRRFVFLFTLCHRLLLSLPSFLPSIHPSSIIMATNAPATGASALTTAVTGAPAIDRSDTAPQKNKKIRVIKPIKFKKCCFNEPGGPWPRLITLS